MISHETEEKYQNVSVLVYQNSQKIIMEEYYLPRLDYVVHYRNPVI